VVFRSMSLAPVSDLVFSCGYGFGVILVEHVIGETTMTSLEPFLVISNKVCRSRYAFGVLGWVQCQGVFTFMEGLGHTIWTASLVGVKWFMQTVHSYVKFLPAH